MGLLEPDFRELSLACQTNYHLIDCFVNKILHLRTWLIPEAVGSFWLRKVAKLMVQWSCDGFRVFEPVRFSHGRFRLVVEPRYNTRR